LKQGDGIAGLPALRPHSHSLSSRKLNERCAHQAEAHPVYPGGVSADQRRCVVRDRIELSTFRFSGGRSYRLSYLTSAM
jgi:hypothetical protein